ncbi:MAG: ubiquinone/menaquinone biosynthesis methyltransferase [Alphaproteobacteria bacterium]
MAASGAEGDGDDERSLAGLARSYGYARVEADERRRRVRATFDGIAAGYDRANDLMSLGLHRLWKRRLAAGVTASGPILDLAGGTGDVAALLRRARAERLVVGGDPSPAMLAVDRRRHGAATAVVALEAERLPLANASVAAVTFAFGLRNVTEPAATLAEIARVLEPGGRLHLLEFSTPVWWLRPLYRRASALVLPWLGGRVTGRPEAYRYLAQSIDRFPTAAAVSAALARAGLRVERVEPLAGSIAVIHVARRAPAATATA